MTVPDAVGIAAAACTTVSFVPQVHKIISTRRADDISLPMYVIFTVGVSLWIFYGVMIKSLPVIIANGITIVLSAVIIRMKIRYR